MFKQPTNKSLTPTKLQSQNNSDEDISDNKGNKAQGENANYKANKQAALNSGNKTSMTQQTELQKGFVADRVEKINSNPLSPTPVKMPKAKAASRMRTLVSQNGQLGIQGVQNFASAVTHKLRNIQHDQEQQDSDDDSSDLSTILKELASTVKKLEKQLKKMDSKREELEGKVSMIQIVQDQEVLWLKEAMDKIDNNEDKIEALIGVVVRQDQQIQALTNQVNSAYANKCQKNILINSIPQTQGEDCFHEVVHFFKNTLKIQKKIAIKYAKRIGKGQHKPMLVKLVNVNEKADIFQSLDKLKEINKSRDRPFFITDQLPEAWVERKKYIHFLKQQNGRIPQEQRKKAVVKNNTLLLDDEEYKQPVQAPTVSQFLKLSPERRKIIRHLDIFKGEEKAEKDSIFIGYAAQVFSPKQEEDYYYHIKLLAPEATHIMCAYKFPGVDLMSTQGSIDDGEHAAGRNLLTLLNKQGCVNKALYVVRYYGGKNIGPQRFSLIETAAKSALEVLLHHERRMRQPPTDQEL